VSPTKQARDSNGKESKLHQVTEWRGKEKTLGETSLSLGANKQTVPDYDSGCITGQNQIESEHSKYLSSSHCIQTDRSKCWIARVGLFQKHTAQPVLSHGLVLLSESKTYNKTFPQIFIPYKNKKNS